MVLLAVSISKLTKYDSSQYKVDLQAHGNNSHCIANAVNTLAGCLFYDMGAEVQRNIENRLTEFLAVSFKFQFYFKKLTRQKILLTLYLI